MSSSEDLTDKEAKKIETKSSSLGYICDIATLLKHVRVVKRPLPGASYKYKIIDLAGNDIQGMITGHTNLVHALERHGLISSPAGLISSSAAGPGVISSPTGVILPPAAGPGVILPPAAGPGVISSLAAGPSSAPVKIDPGCKNTAKDVEYPLRNLTELRGARLIASNLKHIVSNGGIHGLPGNAYDFKNPKDNLYVVECKFLFDKDSTIPEAAAAAADLIEHAKIFSRAVPYMKVRMVFPQDYPASPPTLVMIVHPQAEMYTGHVTGGGSFCSMLLVLGAAYYPMSIDNLFRHIIDHMLDPTVEKIAVPSGASNAICGPLRFNMSTNAKYTEAKAMERHKENIKFHSKEWIVESATKKQKVCNLDVQNITALTNNSIEFEYHRNEIQEIVRYTTEAGVTEDDVWMAYFKSGMNISATIKRMRNPVLSKQVTLHLPTDSVVETVMKLLAPSIRIGTIVKIEYVDNPSLTAECNATSLRLHSLSASTRTPQEHKEFVVQKWVWHGTSVGAITNITTGGFDANVSSLKGLQGAGTYASTCPIVAGGYAVQKGNTTALILCKLCPGRSGMGMGKPDMRMPPDGYDSTASYPQHGNDKVVNYCVYKNQLLPYAVVHWQSLPSHRYV